MLFFIELDAKSAGIFLVVFTILFILMDEYIAKPLRKRRLETRAETEPEIRKVLEIAARVHARHGGKDP